MVPGLRHIYGQQSVLPANTVVYTEARQPHEYVTDCQSGNQYSNASIGKPLQQCCQCVQLWQYLYHIDGSVCNSSAAQQTIQALAGLAKADISFLISIIGYRLIVMIVRRTLQKRAPDTIELPRGGVAVQLYLRMSSSQRRSAKTSPKPAPCTVSMILPQLETALPFHKPAQFLKG